MARLVSPSVVGIDTRTVSVEVDLRAGLSAFAIVGLPDAAVQEARERVRSGIENQGFALPARRIVANLAPADLRKAGPQYDLPIALAILVASGQIPERALDGAGAVGELGLDGAVRAVPGVVAMADHARRRGWARLVVPASLAAHARLSRGVEVLPARGLRHAVDLLTGACAPEHDSPRRAADEPAPEVDLRDLRGQGGARRALEIAAAGGHSLLMLGSPGSGKTMMARSLPGILPPPSETEMMEITRIHSVVGALPPGQGMLRRRPFRAPHHTISRAGLLGGGRVPTPGEITLAHRGVLFLDEVCAFAPATLDALRQPLEEGCVRVSRGLASVAFPAQPMVVCAGNPCPCGFAGDTRRACTCAAARADAYRARLSGPVVDRIDVWIEVPRLGAQELAGDSGGEASELVRARVLAAQEARAARGQACANALLDAPAIAAIDLVEGAKRLIRRAADELALTGRGYGRVLRVARTVADLDRSERVAVEHVSEALALRRSAVAA